MLYYADLLLGMAMAKPSRFKPFSPPPLPPKPSSNHSSGASDHSRSPSGPLNDLDIVVSGVCDVVVPQPPAPPTRHASRLEKSSVDKAVQADISAPCEASLPYQHSSTSSCRDGSVSENHTCRHHTNTTLPASSAVSLHSHCCCRVDYLLCSTTPAASNGHAGCCNAIILPYCAFNNLNSHYHHHCISGCDSRVFPNCGRQREPAVKTSQTLPIRSKTPPARVSRLDHHKEKHHKTQKSQQHQPDIVTSHDSSLSCGSRPSSGSSTKKSRWSRALAKLLPSSTAASSDNQQSFNHHSKTTSAQSTSPIHHSSSSRRSRSLNRFKTMFQPSTSSITEPSSASTAAPNVSSIATSTDTKSSTKPTDHHEVHKQQVRHHHSRSQAVPQSTRKPVRSSAPNPAQFNGSLQHSTPPQASYPSSSGRLPPRRSHHLPASGIDSGGSSSSSSSPVQSQRVIPPPAVTGSHTGSNSSVASSVTAANNPPTATEHTARFAESMRRIKRMAFYWGPLSTAEAEALLSSRPDGTYLVRDSAHDSYILSVSIRANNRTYHSRVEHTRGNQLNNSMLENGFSNSMESYIVSAIEQSTRSNLGLLLGDAESLRVDLRYPLSRYQAVQSLQHLCRFEILCRVRHDHIDYLNLPKSVLEYLKQKQYFAESIDELTNKTSH